MEYDMAEGFVCAEGGVAEEEKCFAIRAARFDVVEEATRSMPGAEGEEEEGGGREEEKGEGEGRLADVAAVGGASVARVRGSDERARARRAEAVGAQRLNGRVRGANGGRCGSRAAVVAAGDMGKRSASSCVYPRGFISTGVVGKRQAVSVLQRGKSCAVRGICSWMLGCAQLLTTGFAAASPDSDL